ncbi:acyl-CoA carboxylase epsilon subunit [Streptomyces sp. NPDC004111]|uniref:acyl-CoA carboxylase epsilon subunit n=1 Tax=Streptomyces sp. NPDC004111 TaxID=3364690 RepID=UPI0036BA0AEB
MTTTPTEPVTTAPADGAAAPGHRAAGTPAPGTGWQITGGEPTDEETAALAAVLTALLAHHAATRESPARPTPTDTVWDRPHHTPRIRTGSWRSR